MKTNRENVPWCHVPESTTVDDILVRLWRVVNQTCECGGAGPEEGCQACQTWHFVTGNTDIAVSNWKGRGA